MLEKKAREQRGNQIQKPLACMTHAFLDPPEGGYQNDHRKLRLGARPGRACVSLLGSERQAQEQRQAKLEVDFEDLEMHHDAVVICDKRVRLKFDTESYPP